MWFMINLNQIKKALEALPKRTPTKNELQAFKLSKWSSLWCIILPFLGSSFIIAMINKEKTIIFSLFPFIVFVSVLCYRSYQKRKEHINSRMVYFLKGTLWFDKEDYTYYIDNNELKLHRKWRKVIEEKKLPINNVEAEALLHTYDNLNAKICEKYQPIVIKGNTLNLKEAKLKSTRSWGILLLYWIAFASIPYSTLNYIGEEQFILNPMHFFTTVTKNNLFIMTTTILWWASVITTIYLSFILVKRIKGHYFENTI